MNTVKIALAATAAVALILLASCGGGGYKASKVGIPEAETTMPDAVPDADGFITDARDGRKYRTVKIGKLVWMAENLNFVTDSSWCYDNDDANCKKYGRLYDWNTAMKACPKGWRLPSSEDWHDLNKAVGDYATKLKSKTGWDKNGNGTDAYGFSALPGGMGDGFPIDPKDCCEGLGSIGVWWSAEEYGKNRAIFHDIYSDSDDMCGEDLDKGFGFSVRCVKNERP